MRKVKLIGWGAEKNHNTRLMSGKPSKKKIPVDGRYCLSCCKERVYGKRKFCMKCGKKRNRDARKAWAAKDRRRKES